MIKKINMKNSLFLTGVLVISLFSIILMMFLSRNCCFWGDDAFFAMYNPDEGLFDCLKFSYGHGGGYIGYFLCKFFCFALPNMLGIHPSDFIGIPNGLIRGIFNVIILLLLSKFALIYSKSKLIYLIVFAFTVSYFYSAAIPSDIIIVNYNWYRYFFSLMFFSVFWYLIYKNIELYNNCTQNPPPQKKSLQNVTSLIILIICGFIIGTSIEPAFFMSGLLSTLIIFYNVLSHIYSKVKKQKFKGFKLNYYFYLPILSLFTAMILFTSSYGFRTVAQDRGMSCINISADLLKEFTTLYYKVCFTDELFYWLIFIIIFSISFYFACKKQEINKFIFPLLFQISILTVMFSLVLCGKTYHEDLYLYHMNITFLYKMLILYPMLVYFDYAYKNIYEITNKKKMFKIMVFVILGIITVFIIKNLYMNKTYIFNDNRLKQCKTQSYILQKFINFYYLKDECPKISLSMIEYNTFLKDDNKEEFLNSMYLIYKNPRILELGYEISYDSDDALERFFNDGGILTEEELSELKFYKLFDSNLVLNKEQEK